jgi:DNA-directed RNA polymerase specialized sigma24 family protein
MPSKPFDDGRRTDLPRPEPERWREITQVAGWSLEIAGSAHPLQRAGVADGPEDGDRPSTVGHLERLACLDASEQLARALAQLPNAHRSHVLLVAHHLSVVQETRTVSG